MKIAVLDDWQGVAQANADWDKLRARGELVFFADAFTSDDDAVAKLAGTDIVLAMRERTQFNGNLVRRLKGVRMIGSTSARTLSLDMAACTDMGILVTNTEGGPGTAATAELALALMLNGLRGLTQADANMRAGKFQQNVSVGFACTGKTLGLIGIGKIGSLMARYGTALGMKIQAWSQNITDEAARAAGATKVDKDTLMATSDVISIHYVLSDRSRGMITATDIARMKPGALLVNTSRGPIVDEAAMLAALRAGRIKAGLDVYDREPLPAEHPLRSLPNTTLSPHLGYCVQEVWDNFYPQHVENALAFLDGKPIRVANPEVLQKRG
ncbi:MAG: D-2-hydroxyacid dehydrogenase family protein [Acetobacteraceae bacterium]|nr:D-2-hydroxyacid dehydrogenase family protein [Acetobacteraceae bacterium]